MKKVLPESMTMRIAYTLLFLCIGSMVTFGQDLPQLKVTERDMTGHIFRCAENNETVVEIQSNVPLTFSSNMDKKNSQCDGSPREENGFFIYELVFPTGERYNGRKLTIQSRGFEAYIQPLDLKAKIPVGLLVTRQADGFYNTGNYIEALKEYEKLRAINPNDNFIAERIVACNVRISSMPATNDNEKITSTTEPNITASTPDDTDSNETTSQTNTAEPTKTTESSDNEHNEPYNPDGIELIYVEGSGGINGFYIGKYEITQAQWKAVMGTNPSKTHGDNLPVERVSRIDIQTFLSRLNERTGKNYRLPTEAEWEFAARGGTANSVCTNGCTYSGSNDLDKVAWYKQNSDKRTHPVGTKQPNELGIYDMSGNVWEWCENFSVNNSYLCVIRGGGCNAGPTKCRVTSRSGGDPDWRNKYLGFRIVLP